MEQEDSGLSTAEIAAHSGQLLAPLGLCVLVL